MEHALVPSVNLEERLEQWITLYGEAILRTCYVYLSDRTQAEDAAQDTFLKAWNNMGQFEGRGDCTEKSWLMRIAINTCRDYQRSRWFRYVDRRKALDELPEMLGGTSPEDRSLFLDILRMPEKYKQVILLYYYQEMTLQEVSDALGVSRSTVHHRLQKAQEQLKLTWLGRDEDEE